VDLAQLDDKRLGAYRHPNERWALLAIALGFVVGIAVLWAARPYLGDVFRFLPGPVIRWLVEWLHPTRIGPVLLVVLAITWAMDVVGQTTKTWQLIAQAVEVTPTTFPQLAPIVDELRRRFDLPRSRVYISRDAPPSGYTIGVREPYAIIFSAIGVGQLTPDEFKFALGRQMGHIKLGHTKMATLLGNAQMQLPQPVSFLLKIRKVLFGSYQQAQELSADRIGVVATRDVRPALSTLIKQNLGSVRGGKVDVKSLASQTAELRRGLSGTALRTSQRLAPQPFPLVRLAELTEWAGEPEEAPAAASAAPTTASATPTSPTPAVPTPAAATASPAPAPASPASDAASSAPATPAAEVRSTESTPPVAAADPRHDEGSVSPDRRTTA
jgi:Zn-dependent protease with chaperone function